MVLLNGVEAGNARKAEVAAAAEAGHVVGGDGFDEDDRVRIYDALVDPDFGAEGGLSEVGLLGFVGGDVLVHGDAAGDFFADAGDVLFVGVGAVGALREDDADVLVGDAGEVQFVYDVDQKFGGAVPGAGDVGDDEADFIAALYDFLQWGAADRASHSSKGRFFDVAGGCRDAFQDVRNMVFRQHDGLHAAAECEFEFFHG